MLSSLQGIVAGELFCDSRAARKGILVLNASTCLSAPSTAVRCRVAAAATLCGSAAEIAAWRKQPVVVGAEKLPASLLKQAEDQTILGLMTVLTALEQQGWHERFFADWGVIAAGNNFGRLSIAQAILRYRQEGAWGVSPNLIPHQSLHAMSGTISQVLKIFGPNFGVNGGPNAGPDAFLIAAAMLMERRLPGLWLVLTGYEPEWIPAADGNNLPAPLCQAVALALTPTESPDAGMCLSIGQVPGAAGKDLFLTLPEFQLGLLVEALVHETAQPGGKWRLTDGHWLELDMTFPGQEGRP